MKTQPVWIGWAATIVIALAARYGLKLDDAQAAGVALVLGTGVQALVHRYVTPVARPRAADGTPMIKANLGGANQPRPTTYRPTRQPGDPPE
jgi:predicted benzoate:H+ symporter BenE